MNQQNFKLSQFVIWLIKGHQIRSRHFLLMKTIGTMLEEDSAFNNINTCLASLTSLILFSSMMEIYSYFKYNNKVNINMPESELSPESFVCKSQMLLYRLQVYTYIYIVMNIFFLVPPKERDSSCHAGMR